MYYIDINEHPRSVFCSHLFLTLQGRTEPDFSALILRRLLAGGMPLDLPFTRYCCKALSIPFPFGKISSVYAPTGPCRQQTPDMAPLHVGWDTCHLAIVPVVAEPLVAMPKAPPIDVAAETVRIVLVCPAWREPLIEDEARSLGLEPLVITWEALWAMLPQQDFWLTPELREYIDQRSEQHTHQHHSEMLAHDLHYALPGPGTWHQWQLLEWLASCFPWPGPVQSQNDQWAGFSFGRMNPGWLRFVNLNTNRADCLDVPLVLHSRHELELDQDIFTRIESSDLPDHLTGEGYYWRMQWGVRWSEMEKWFRVFRPVSEKEDAADSENSLIR